MVETWESFSRYDQTEGEEEKSENKIVFAFLRLPLFQQFDTFLSLFFDCGVNKNLFSSLIESISLSVSLHYWTVTVDTFRVDVNVTSCNKLLLTKQKNPKNV